MYPRACRVDIDEASATIEKTRDKTVICVTRIIFRERELRIGRVTLLDFFKISSQAKEKQKILAMRPFRQISISIRMHAYTYVRISFRYTCQARRTVTIQISVEASRYRITSAAKSTDKSHKT